MTGSTGDGLPLRRPAAAPTVSPAAVVFVGNVVARGLGFLFPVLLARVLGRDDFALAIFVISTGFFVGELVLTGFPTALTRALADDRERSEGSPLLASVIGGVPLLIASLVLGTVLATRGDAPPALLGVVVVGLTIDAYYFAALRGLQRFGTLVAYRVGANLVQLVALAVAASLGVASLPLAVGLYALSYLGPIVVIELMTGPLRQLLRGPGRRRPAAAEVGRIAAFAIPALVSGTAYGAIMGFDVFWVRLFAPDALADYGAARSLAMPMLLVPFAISTVLLPRSVQASPSVRRRLLAQALVIAVGASSLAWLGWLLVGPLVVQLVFPPSYEAAVGPLGLLVPAVALVGVYSVVSQWTLGIGRPWVAARCLTTGALVTVGAHLALTTRLGAHGAALAIAIGAGTALALLGGYALRAERPVTAE